MSRITIIGESSRRNTRGRLTFKLKCECGKVFYRAKDLVKRRGVKSCGCLKLEKAKTFGADMRKYTVKHGLEKTRFYRTYRGIRTRCEYKSSQGYKWYGARGIKCLWPSFSDFKEDMYISYLEHSRKYGEKNTLIERINSSKDYRRSNCRWATNEEQVRNKSNNKFLTFQGERLIVADWARKLGINNQTLWERIKRGWSVDKILSPVRPKL